MATTNSPYRTPLLRPILTKTFKSVRKVKPYSAISTINSLCPKAFYYANRFPEKTVIRDLNAIMNFTLGFIAEDFVERIVKQTRIGIIDKEIEIELEKEDSIGLTASTGRIDFLLRLSDGKYYITEVKKMNPRRFNLFKTRGLQTEASAHSQVISYIHFWNKAIKQGQDLPPVTGLLIGVSIEPTDLLDTSIEYTEEEYNRFIPQLKIIEGYKIAFDELKKAGKDIFEIDAPPRPEGLTWESFQCKACPFFQECYDELPNSITTAKLTEKEIESINSAIVDLRKASYIENDNKRLKEVANDTIKGLLQKHSARSLEFQSTVGSLEASLSFSDVQSLDTQSIYKDRPNSLTPYISTNIELNLNKTIKLSPVMETLASGRITKIGKDGKITVASKLP